MTKKLVKFISTFLLPFLLSIEPSWANHQQGINNPEGMVNIFVPDDVLHRFQNAPKAIKLKHCRASSDWPYQELAQLAQKPPKRLFGYNSRMDNRDDVEGAEEADLFVLRLSEVYMDAWVSEDNSKSQAALDALYAWAKVGALTETKPCAREGNILDTCSEWTQSDGQDLSDKKDHSTAQIHIMHLAYGYYLTLASFRPDDPKHDIIQQWINGFFQWNKRPRGVYIGLDLGWHWPGVLKGTIENAPKYSGWNPSELLTNAVQELDKVILEDGSIKDRTTRGNKGLWYHHTGLIETMITLEMARKNGIKIPPSLEQRLAKAGEIFIRGFADHSYLDQWAKVAHNGIYTPGKQDFRDNLDLPNGSSWFYIFSYRYPEADFTMQLDKILMQYPRNGRRDGYVGFGLGCIYAVAKEVGE